MKNMRVYRYDFSFGFFNRFHPSKVKKPLECRRLQEVNEKRMRRLKMGTIEEMAKKEQGSRRQKLGTNDRI